MRVKRVIIILLLLASKKFVFSYNNDSIINIKGCIRTKWEYNLNTEKNRFQVRNARYQVSGKLNEFFGYKAEIDLSDEGVTKMLDAFIEMNFTKKLKLILGQQKIPYSTDNLRNPCNLNFSNRSFIAKRISKNLRDVGAVFSYKDKILIPIEIYTGVFNGKGLYEQDWVNENNFANRIVVNPFNSFFISGNLYTGKSDSLNIKMWNTGIHYYIGNFQIDMEFAQKNERYPSSKTKNKVSSFFYILYNFETGKNKLTKVVPAIRYDNYKNDIADKYFEPQRITGGITLVFGKKENTYIRISYENYFYKTLPEVEDKFLVEFVVIF